MTRISNKAKIEKLKSVASNQGLPKELRDKATAEIIKLETPKPKGLKSLLKDEPKNTGVPTGEEMLDKLKSKNLKLKTKMKKVYPIGTKVVVSTGENPSDGVITDKNQKGDKSIHGHYWAKNKSYLVKFDNGTTQYIPSGYIELKKTELKSAFDKAKEKSKSRKSKAIKKSIPKHKKEKSWKQDALTLLKKEVDVKDLRIMPGTDDSEFIAEGGNTEYRVFKTYSDAEYAATQYVKDMLDDEPENFSQDWLSNHLYVSDTDKRIIAGEEADHVVGDMTDEDIIERASEYTLSDYENEEDDGKKDEMLEKSKEVLHDEIYNEWYKGLDKDPIGFLVDDQGMYSREDALRASFVQVDTNKAAEDAIDTDGAAHFLSSYDGKQLEDFGGTYVAYRTN